MNTLNRFLGDEVDNQDYYSAYCTYLHGRFPERMDILKLKESQGCVLFDGECWRVFDLEKLSRDRIKL